MVIHDRGIIWHGGQEGPAAQWFKLAASRHARLRTPCKEMRFPLVMTQEISELCLVAIASGM